MLRNQRHTIEAHLCRQDRTEESDDQAQSTRKDDPRDCHPPVAGPQEHRQVPQLLRRSDECVHRSGTVQKAFDDGTAQAATRHHRLRMPFLCVPDIGGRQVFARQQYHPSGLEAGQFVSERPAERENRRLRSGHKNRIRRRTEEDVVRYAELHCAGDSDQNGTFV